jgi:hypothetical protein
MFVHFWNILPVLVDCVKENLATLSDNRRRRYDSSAGAYLDLNVITFEASVSQIFATS